jgi:D-beta-D-heptose 7-phosphate kinase / D-beta-D-heptose 1-phosphate adenosyltransferase
MTDQRKYFREIISSFANRNVLVIGDAILDVYVRGKSNRLTPEAPVPVVDVTQTDTVLGGAANTVCNLRTLGARVSFCTVVGEDNGGEQIKTLLKEIQAEDDGVISETGRDSQVKTRILSSNHIVTRYDVGTRTKITGATEEAIIEYLKRSFETFDCIVISDYDKGLITENILMTIVDLNLRYQKQIAIDSKRLSFFQALRASFAKPNYEEAISLIDLPFAERNRKDQILQNMSLLREKINADIIAVTMDEHGSIFSCADGTTYVHPAIKVDHPYVSGAGDTFQSAAFLAMLFTKQIDYVQTIATTAASIAIRKETTSSCTLEELLTFFPSETKILSSHDNVREQIEHYRRLGKRIVFTNGCFDILHSGHVTYLQCAKDLGDVLIVGINTDESIKRIKGNDRPINSLNDRMQVIAGLHAVDHVIAFGSKDDDTPVELIDIIKPDVFVKGGDYSLQMLPEAKTIKANGGEIVFIPYIPDHSTTQIINKITRHVSVYDAEMDRY